MDFGLTEEQRMIVDTTRAFVETELYPHEQRVERTGVLTYGRTVIDVHGVTGEPPNSFVARSADADRYLDVLLRTLG